MKRLVFIILIVTISMLIGYKSYNVINRPKQFESGRVNNFMKSDIIGEIESISQNEISLKLIKLTIPDNKNNSEKERFKTKYTGENKNIILSSDIEIFKYMVAEKVMKQVKISISDLKTGDVLNISYKEDKSTMDKIVINEAT